MDWIQKSLQEISRRLGGLTVSQKLLIGTLLITVPMVLWVVGQYAAKPQMVPVLDQALEASQRARIIEYMDMHRVPYQMIGDRIVVPSDQRHAVVARLSLQHLLPEDTSEGFKSFLKDRTWWTTTTQNQQLFDIALQSELNRVVSAFPWVQKATIIISRPQKLDFGANYTRPTASINVVMADGRLDQKKVDAVAGLVSGSVAGMKPEDVSVIDAVAGRPWKVRGDTDVASGDYLETIQSYERQYYEKISNVLRYIPDVIVAVNVEVNMTRQQIDSKAVSGDDPKTLVKRENTNNTENKGPGTGGEPGVRSNTGEVIVGAESNGTLSTSEQAEVDYIATPFYVHTASSQPAGAPKRISATVNVPRSYFIKIFQRGQNAEAQPTDEQLKPVVDEHLPRIRTQIETLVKLKDDPGSVVVDMYADGGGMAAGTAMAAAGSEGWGTSGSGPWQTGVLIALAVLSLGMMLLMVRKASQRPPVPTMSELAGVELDELRTMARDRDGNLLPEIAVDEQAAKHEQIVDQVSEMAKNQPQDLANMVRWWMTQEASE